MEIKRTAAEVQAMMDRAEKVEAGGDDRVMAYMDGVFDVCDWLLGSDPDMSLPMPEDDDS